MADLIVTAASVVKGTGASTATGIAGEAITAGQPLYIDATDNGELKLADANDTAAKAAIAGIALHAASTGQPITYQTSGEITIGVTVAVGTLYVVSATAGGIAPIADLVSTNYVSVIGIAKTAAILTLGLNNTGIQKA